MARASLRTRLPLLGLLALGTVAWTPSGSPTPAPREPRRTQPQARLAALVAGAARSTPSGGVKRVPVTARLAPGEDARSLGLLEVAPGIGAVWAEPGELMGVVERLEHRSPWVSPPLKLLMDRSGAWTGATAAHALGKTGKGVVFGTIDTGVDLAHRDLRDPVTGKTRVAWLLDLASIPRGIHPDIEKKFGCDDPAFGPCSVLSAADIDALLEGGIDSVPGDSVGHGTHTTSIAAGNGGGTKLQYVGVAPEATLVVARVTRSEGGEGIGDADILNAVSFVFDRAQALKMPAVVNISLGGDFGPHDGTSPLEVGLAAFVGPTKPGRAITVAAGNSAGIFRDDAGLEYGVHTEARTLAGSPTRAILTFPVHGQPVTGTAYVWINFRPGEQVSVALEQNGKSLITAVAPGEQSALDAVPGTPYVAVVNGVVSATSPINAGTTAAVVALDGTWSSGDQFTIILDGASTAQLWVQGTGGAEYGSELGGATFLRPMKQGTINVPATHPSLIAVGCTLNRLDWQNIDGENVVRHRVGSLDNPPGDTACYFSSAGPNADGVAKPEISAPGGFVAAAMAAAANPKKSARSMFASPPGSCVAGTSCNVVDSTHAIASGTSMSAPHVAGAIALLLQRDPTLTQDALVGVLQGGSRKFQGVIPYDYQVGPGALSTTGSLTVLEERTSKEPLIPSAGQSSLHLSAGFARPDPSWPITGTLVLRTADLRPANAFDESALTLETENALFVQRLRRVGPGLYRFVVAGPAGSGGERLQITARYAGEIIGQRSLAIAPDVFTAREAPEANGGCAMAGGGGAPRRASGIWLFGVVALGLAALRRRRLFPRLAQCNAPL